MTRQGFCAVLVFTFACLSAPPSHAQSSQGMPPEVAPAMERGISAAKQQQWDLAVKYFGEARKALPFYGPALFNLALAHDRAGGSELIAAAWYHAFLAGSPQDPKAETVRGRITDLEIRVEANVRKLIRRAMEAFPAMEEYLSNSEAPLQNERAKLQLELASAFGSEKRNKTIAELKKNYRDQESERPYSVLAEAQARIGDVAGAKETLRKMPAGSDQTEPVREIVRQQSASGDFAGANDTAATLRSSSFYDLFILHDIAPAQAKAGDFPGARDSATKISRPDYRVKCFLKIASEEIERGKTAGAGKTLLEAKRAADEISDPKEKNSALMQVSGLQIKAGDLTAARETIGRISGDSDHVLAEFAKAQFRGGDLRGAGETAARIKQERARSDIYSDIAESELNAGKLAASEKAADLAADGYYRKGLILWRLVSAKVKAGDMAGAKRAAEKISDHSSRVSAHAEIANALSGAGDPKGAREALQEMRRSAEGITDKSQRANAAYSIADAQIRAGDIEGARKTARETEEGSSFTRSRILFRVVSELSKKGDINGAAEEVQKIALEYDTGSLRAGGYISIAQALAQKGDREDAFSWAEKAKGLADSMKDPSKAWPIHVGIARVQAAAGDMDGAMRTAERIQDSYYKTHALLAVAGGHIARSDRDAGLRTLARAMDSASVISSDFLRAYSFAELEKKFGEVGEAELAKKAADAAAQTRSSEKRVSEVPAVKASPTGEAEIKAWTRLAMEDFSKKAMTKPETFFESLKGRNPRDTVLAIAEAARDMAEAFQKLRSINAKN